ncbi:O-antigen ligase family protein [Macellibacteroides fermentans]|uniref:O-antigen ligase family protein n=1 Tax=Macellibacteroides fermentans TaxID=879969 RepID=UPI003B92933F
MLRSIYILTILYIGFIPLEAVTIADGITMGRIVFFLMFGASLFKAKICYKIDRKNKHFKYLLLFSIFCFFSILWSRDFAMTLDRSAYLIQYLIITIVSTNILNSRKKISWAMIAYIAGCLYIGYISYKEFGLFASERMSYRGDMTAGNPNENAFLINYAIIFLLIFWNWLDSSEKLKRYLCAVIILIFSCIILLLGSRNGLIMLVSTFLMYSIPTIFKRGGLQSFLILSLLIGFTIYMFYGLPEELQERYMGIKSQIEDNEMAGRGYIWAKAIDMISQPGFPILWGTGWGSFVSVFNSYAGMSIGAHNFYLSLIVTTGIIGFTIVMIYLASLFRYVKQSNYTNKHLYYLLIIIPMISMTTTNWEFRKWWFVISIFIYSFYKLRSKK